MAKKNSCAILLAAFLCGTSVVSATRTVYLSEITPQGIIRVGALAANDKDECDYKISSSDVSGKDGSKNVGISVGALGLQLSDGAYIEMFLELPDSKNANCSWNDSVSYNPKFMQKECIHTQSDICIRLKNWKQSTATILLSLYYDISNGSEVESGNCPEGTTLCDCNYNEDGDDSSSEEVKSGKGKPRCIPNDLFCNGISNCGLNCNFDESEAASCNTQSQIEDEACIWTKFEYVAMLVMTGLMLLLIPVLFFLVCLYHRRRRGFGGEIPRNFDRNNNMAENSGRYPYVISTLPANIDPPPNYDDLPDELKVASTPAVATHVEIEENE